jgi:hypothetical protein
MQIVGLLGCLSSVVPVATLLLSITPVLQENMADNLNEGMLCSMLTTIFMAK